MNLLNKLTIKNLKLNKKRTIVTIIGIMLSVALITAVTTMYSSAIKSLINYETYHKGEFHVAFYDVNKNDLGLIKNNKGIDEIYLTKNVGYAKLKNSKNENKPYAYVKSFTSEALKHLAVKLVEGRLPENDNEIVIPSHLKTNGRIDLKVGDTVTLDIGTRMSDGYELKQDSPYNTENNEEIINITSKTYKIVGIIERPANNVEAYSAPGYTFITYLSDNNISGNVDVYARFNKYGSANYLRIMANVLDISEDAMIKKANDSYESEEDEDAIIAEIAKAKYDFNINIYLIQLENNPLKENTMAGLGVVVGIVLFIIVATSVFCIKNSFDISITEKIKQYGMLRSVGATKKQIKRNVFYEGTILGLIGIPLGLVLGFGASLVLIYISNFLLADAFSNGLKLVFGFSWIAVIVACILGSVTIYLSALRSANKASKVSPINSIRNSADIKIKSKKLKTPFFVKKIFGIGGEISYKNFKRNKKRYRTTVISIVVSVAVFIGLSYFISGAFRMISKEITTYDYNLALIVSNLKENPALKSKMLDTINLDNIKEYMVERDLSLYIKNPKYNKEYIKTGNYDEEYIKQDSYIHVITMGEYQYKKYLKDLNLDYDEYQDKTILFASNEELEVQDENNKSKIKYIVKYDYKNGDTISTYNELNETNHDLVIGHITDKKPFAKNNYETILIISDKKYDELFQGKEYMTIYYSSDNPNKLQDDIDEVLSGEEYYLENIEQQAKLMNNLFTLIAIFLYGFIIVISLIGITNIFNTITTNMNLRKQEFAMLKSIGMTNQEFKKMIRLESVFIGAKSLLFGIPIGLGISYLIYHFMESESGFIFKFPIVPIIICIVVVYLLITVLMKYSMSKINKENTIETIRNENI